MIIIQCIEAFVNETGKENQLAKILERFLKKIVVEQKEQNEMEFFMGILKELSLFVQIKMSE